MWGSWWGNLLFLARPQLGSVWWELWQEGRERAGHGELPLAEPSLLGLC